MFVGGNDAELLIHCLAKQQPITGIAMMPGQLAHGIRYW